MKATRFMRTPFFVKGYLVTLENMEDIATWCKGHVVDKDSDQPFVRVPVNRASNEKMTRGYVGTWVTVSRHRGENSFKVYTAERLMSEFVEMPDDIAEIPELISATPPLSNVSPHFRSPTPGARS